MTRDGKIRLAIGGEHIVKHSLRSDILVNLDLAVVSLPQLIRLSKARLDLVFWKSLLNVGFGPAAITSMSADTLAEEFLDGWHKRMPTRQLQPAESEIGSRKTSSQRTGVVTSRRGDFLIFEPGSPESIDGQSLFNTLGCQSSIVPSHRTVAVHEGPVAIPSGGSVVTLGGVVIALAMTAHEKQLVLDFGTRVPVESKDLVLKALPLCLLAIGIISRICGVCTIDQAEVGVDEAERAGIGRSFILKKVACHSRVINVRVMCGRRADISSPAYNNGCTEGHDSRKKHGD